MMGTAEILPCLFLYGKKKGVAPMENGIPVSIIVPVYNVSAYLDDCMRSLVRQTLRGTEIICVDDASTDGSWEILQKYAAEYSGIRLIRLPENGSAYTARIRGVQASRGRYIMFVDPDDYLADNACEKLYRLISRYRCDMLHFVSEVVGKEAQSSRGVGLSHLINPSVRKLNGDLVRACFARNQFGFQLWNKIYRGDLVRLALRGCRDEYLPKAQDLYIFFQIAFRASSYRSFMTEPLYYYRMGVGVTGGSYLTPDQLKKNGMQLLIPGKLRAFLEENQAGEKYAGVVEQIENNLITDSLCKLGNYTYQEDKASGWRWLCEYMPKERLLQNLAVKYYMREENALDLCDLIIADSPRPSELKTIGTFYPRLMNGGVQRVMAHLVNVWQQMGFRVVVITEDKQSDEYDLPADVTRYCLPAFDGQSEEMKASNGPDRIARICRIVREEKIDLFISHQWLSTFMIWDLLAVKLSGALFGIHCHSVFSVPLIEKTMLHLYKTMPDIYHRADGIFVLSPADEYYWRQYNPETYRVVNPLPFENLRSEPLALRNHTVLWVGRMSMEKRPFDIPEIMRRVVSAVPDAKLVMVGGGNPDIESELMGYIREKSLENNIVLTGFQKDVAPFYRDASVYLSTSEFEGFQVSLGEAQIYGLPVVGYDLFYLSILEKKTGCMLAPIGRVDLLAEMIIHLLTSPEDYRRFSEEALRNIGRFNVDLSAQWRRIFDSLMRQEKADEQDSLGKLALDTIRQQVTLVNSWNSLTGVEKSDLALELAFPEPKSGPARSVRRKAALFLRVLLIDGFRSVADRLKAKKAAKTDSE